MLVLIKLKQFSWALVYFLRQGLWLPTYAAGISACELIEILTKSSIPEVE